MHSLKHSVLPLAFSGRMRGVSSENAGEDTQWKCDRLNAASDI